MTDSLWLVTLAWASFMVLSCIPIVFALIQARHLTDEMNELCERIEQDRKEFLG